MRRLYGGNFPLTAKNLSGHQWRSTKRRLDIEITAAETPSRGQFAQVRRLIGARVCSLEVTEDVTDFETSGLGPPAGFNTDIKGDRCDRGR